MIGLRNFIYFCFFLLFKIEGLFSFTWNLCSILWLEIINSILQLGTIILYSIYFIFAFSNMFLDFLIKFTIFCIRSAGSSSVFLLTNFEPFLLYLLHLYIFFISLDSTLVSIHFHACSLPFHCFSLSLFLSHSNSYSCCLSLTTSHFVCLFQCQVHFDLVCVFLLVYHNVCLCLSDFQLTFLLLSLIHISEPTRPY